MAEKCKNCFESFVFTCVNTSAIKSPDIRVYNPYRNVLEIVICTKYISLWLSSFCSWQMNTGFFV